MASSSSGISHSYLRTLDDEAQQNIDRVRALFDSLTKEQITWKPDPNTWSIAECIEHLIVTDSQYIPNLTDALERAEGKRGGGDASYRPGFFAKKFINAAGENGKLKLKAPTKFRPDQAGHGGDAGAGGRFIAGQENLRGLIRRADGLNINRTKLPSPISPLFRFSIGEAFTLMISHQKRHLAQAERMEEKVRSAKLEV